MLGFFAEIRFIFQFSVNGRAWHLTRKWKYRFLRRVIDAMHIFKHWKTHLCLLMVLATSYIFTKQWKLRSHPTLIGQTLFSAFDTISLILVSSYRMSVILLLQERKCIWHAMTERVCELVIGSIWDKQRKLHHLNLTQGPINVAKTSQAYYIFYILLS